MYAVENSLTAQVPRPNAGIRLPSFSWIYGTWYILHKLLPNNRWVYKNTRQFLDVFGYQENIVFMTIAPETLLFIYSRSVEHWVTTIDDEWLFFIHSDAARSKTNVFIRLLMVNVTKWRHSNSHWLQWWELCCKWKTIRYWIRSLRCLLCLHTYVIESFFRFDPRIGSLQYKKHTFVCRE